MARIAYFANYLGPDLIARRHITSISLAGTRKISLIARLLADLGHEVSVFSRGSAVESPGRYHSGFSSPLDALPGAPTVHYAPCWEASYPGAVLGIWTFRRMFLRAHSCDPFHAILMYNANNTETTTALWAARRRGLPVVLEYEDATVSHSGRVGWISRSRRRMFARIHPFLKGALVVCPELAGQVGQDNMALLRGIVSDDILTDDRPRPEGPTRFFFAGTMAPSKGVDMLMDAWKDAVPGAELHLAGGGPFLDKLQERYSSPSVRFHGFVDQEAFVRLLAGSDVCVNPHEASRMAGSFFPFKVIEYLGAGKPVVSTRMGFLEPELEQGLLYSESATPESFRRALGEMSDRLPAYRVRAARAREAVAKQYGLAAVQAKLASVIDRALASGSSSSG